MIKWCWLFTVLFLISCDSQTQEKPKEPEKSEKQQANLQHYRIISSGSPKKVRTVHLNMQLKIPSDIISEMKQAKKDQYGNWVLQTRLPDNDKAHAYIVKSGKGPGINIVSTSPKTGITSVYDLDGDGSIDLMDVREIDGSRFTIIDERMVDILRGWTLGNNPLCGDDPLLGNLGLSGFGCGNSEGGNAGGSNSGGGRPAGNGDSPLIDPFDSICAPYRNGASGNSYFDGPVYSQEGGTGSLRNPGASITNSIGIVGNARIIIHDAVSTFPDGSVSLTTRDIIYEDANEGGRLVTIREVTDADGVGTRTVTDHRTGETELSSLAVEVGDDGRRPQLTSDVAANDPDAPPEVHETPSEEDTTTTDEGAEVRPDRDGVEDEDALRRWCEITDPNRDRGGAADEARKSLDEALNAPICLDDGPARENCVSFPVASTDDIRDFLGESGGGGCGSFERPGPDGNCGPASLLERFRGLAQLEALRAGIIDWCDPRVCQPVPGS